MQQSEMRKLPVWALGMANCPLGFVFGFISTAMGILLAARGVSVGRVSAISAIAFSPTFWAWSLSPVVDVRFTKRTYGFLFSGLAALLLGVAVLSLGNLTLFTAATTASCVAAVLYGNSIGGWAPDIVVNAEYDALGGWSNVANLGAAGLFGAVTVLCVRVLPLPIAALCLAMLVFAPAMLLFHFPDPPRPEGTLRENFASMGRDLKRVAREGRIWIGLMIFLSPVAFALTNLFSTMGADFHASENAVTTLNGPLVAIVCSLGCLLAIPLCRRFQRRTIYMMAGVGSAVAAAGLGLLPHTVYIYAGGLLLYNFFQGFNYTAFTALELEIVGPKNALSGTMMAILTASSNVPISTMTFIDGKMHDKHGLRAMLLTDASASVATAALLLLVALPLFDRYIQRKRETSA